jgi:AsmA-like C-terminal region
MADEIGTGPAPEANGGGEHVGGDGPEMETSAAEIEASNAVAELQSERAPDPLPPQKTRKPGRLKRWLIWTSVVVLVVCLAIGIAVAILLHRAEPLLRAAMIDTLEKRFHSKVELDNLHVSVLDGFWVEGNGLKIWLPPEAIAEVDPQGITASEPVEWRVNPWISVGKFKFHVGWRIRPGVPIEISVIHVEGARVLLPPKEDRPKLNMSGATPESKPDAQAVSGETETPQSAQQPSQGSSFFKMPRIVVHRIECNQAQLVIERKQDPKRDAGKPPKVPLDFELNKITLMPDSNGGPVAYSVDMVNAKPIGTIHTTGHFGPWVAGDPGALPITGNYLFDNADLSTIKGIAGILASTGRYTGTLRRLETDGETRTPDFRLERVHKGPGVLLTTRFHAIVDGTNGNTYLQPVIATLGHTHFVAKGQVVRADDVTPGAHGHDITLQVNMDKGRIEDILEIAADADQPFLTGALTLNTSFHLPPNPPAQELKVFDRLLLDGQFHLSGSKFNNASMQGKIAQLSLRGQGKPDEIKATDPGTIASEIQGHFKLGNGSLQLPDLLYTVPGAKIKAHGVYGLQGGTLDFEGDADLDATVSQIVGGWKGMLLKPVDGYLRKNGAGTDVPIHVKGTRKEPKFGVDFGRMGKTDHSQSNDPN